MNGGEISGNSASSYGGGVDVSTNGTFTMSGGEISGNTAGNGGGGVVIEDSSSIFAKTGGTIYGYDVNDLVHSNKVETNSAIVNDKGHAVYRDATYRKETTIGENDELFYNYPGTGQHSGW
jgi:hypothetical protein